MPSDELIDQSMTGAPAVADQSGGIFPTGLAPGEQPLPDDFDPESSVGPEEQEQYDQLATRTAKFIWGKGRQHVLKMLNARGREFFENAGEAAYQIVATEVKKAEQAGVKISPDAAFAAAADVVVPTLFELAEAAKIVEFPDEEREQHEMGKALMEAERLHGNNVLSGKDGPMAQREAQELMAQKVAEEADAGEIDPEFVNALRGQGNGTRATS